MDLGLKNKVALVLASSKGLGKAAAMALANEGCRLAVCGRDPKTLNAAAKEIKRITGAPVLAEAMDVENKRARERMIGKILKRYGGIDILVTNSGGPVPGKSLELPDREWPKAVSSTLMVAVDWTRAVAPVMMKKRWGRIIHILSISVKQPIDGLILSNTMRAGAAGFAKTTATELAPHGILVNALCPGLFLTGRLEELIERRRKQSGRRRAEEAERMASEIPLGRIGRPEELGSVIAFLASERASFITGAVLQVDGGLYRGLL
ncbi:MAG: SDR family oxidoreductase [Elusimicrobia bacterium]|nr:SDR family oxidoreductase [Elusimicrobiota bacterium]